MNKPKKRTEPRKQLGREAGLSGPLVSAGQCAPAGLVGAQPWRVDTLGPALSLPTLQLWLFPSFLDDVESGTSFTALRDGGDRSDQERRGANLLFVSILV